MAHMILADGSRIEQLEPVVRRLAALNIALRHWPTPVDPEVVRLLEKPVLDQREQEALLSAVDDRFEALRQEAGYTTRDVVVINEHIPGLDQMLAKFAKIHFHTDDEVRYVLAGRGYFGFVEADGGQVMLEVGPGDYINVPANLEHWFTLGDSRRIKAVRYFIDSAGWAPVYTGRPILFG